MCSEGGSDAYEVSESTSEASAECKDATSELCENGEPCETNESSDNLVENTDPQYESELVDNGAEPTADSEGDDGHETEVSEDSDSQEDSDAAEDDADLEAIRAEINEKSNYSDEVNEKISSVEELEVYQKANLKEEKIDGRTCLVRDDIDMDYVDPKTGKTNQELMKMGRAPYDAKTGEKIELHHIGQDYDSPLAELTEDSEHGDYYCALHTKEGESWRNDSKKSNHYNNVDRPNHWKSRVNGG